MNFFNLFKKKITTWTCNINWENNEIQITLKTKMTQIERERWEKHFRKNLISKIKFSKGRQINKN